MILTVQTSFNSHKQKPIIGIITPYCNDNIHTNYKPATLEVPQQFRVNHDSGKMIDYKNNLKKLKIFLMKQVKYLKGKIYN